MDKAQLRKAYRVEIIHEIAKLGYEVSDGVRAIRVTNGVGYGAPVLCTWDAIDGYRDELLINGRRGRNYSKKLRFRPPFNWKTGKIPKASDIADKIVRCFIEKYHEHVRECNENQARDEAKARLRQYNFMDGVRVLCDHEVFEIELITLPAVQRVIQWLIDNQEIEWTKGVSTTLIEIVIPLDNELADDLLELIEVSK
ncbi:MAG: hypothetical protein ACYS7Y_04165 [Planctomycetota bacterium]|jgi:hypothetical protein